MRKRERGDVGRLWMKRGEWRIYGLRLWKEKRQGLKEERHEEKISGFARAVRRGERGMGSSRGRHGLGGRSTDDREPDKYGRGL